MKYHIPESLAISDSGFLFFARTGETFTLNQIGKEIIRLMQEGLSLDSISTKLIETYDVDEITLQKDLHDFITQLQLHKLVEEQ
ncbi:MAG: PqqD family protein [Ignavibacteria bacterium]|nr:PqqD family protein [Ignavibacteria bacterium]